MKVKVQCGCGSKFEFEVEPVEGRMPTQINCPTCGHDATTLADEVIASQTAAEPQKASGLRIHATPSSQSQSASAPAAAPQAMCARHKSEAVVQTCHVCGKPMCRLCMEQFGNVCSVYCRQQAEARGIGVPAYAGQKSVRQAKSRGIAKLIAVGVFLILFAIPCFWIWYTFFAREPKEVYSIALPKSDWEKHEPYVNPGEYHLIAPGQLLCISNDQVRLLDLKLNQPIWSVTIATNQAEDKYAAFYYEGDNGHTHDRFIANSNDIWIVTGDMLARLDRATGASREIPVKGPYLKIIPTDAAITVVTGALDGDQAINRIALPSGEVQSEPFVVAKKSVASAAPANAKSFLPAKGSQKIPLSKVAKMIAPDSKNTEATEEMLDALLARAESNPILDAGANLVQMKPTLIEQRYEEHAAMKPKKNATSILDSANLTASQGMEVAEEMLNDNRRDATGGMDREDVSTYNVTLHRFFAKDVPDWNGRVSGPPSITTLKTVDVISAGQSIYVIDKQNKKLWESKLTYPIRSSSYDNPDVPMVETADSLFVADKGMVTKFDLATGEVRWRFNTVGTSHMLYDPQLGFYINSTTAGPDSIQFSQQVNLRQKVHTTMIRLDPANGKALWTQEAQGDKVYTSGKFVYAERVNYVTVQLELENGPQPHFYASLLNTKNGDPIWTYHRGLQTGATMEVQNNWVMLQFKDKLVVLKFFSL